MFFYVYARVLGVVLGMPFLSQVEISPRFRAICALGISIVFFSVPSKSYFPEGSDILTAFAIMVREFSVGLLIGFIARFMLAAIDFGGTIIGVISGLSMATVFNPTQSNQTTVVSTFLTMIALTMFLVLDGHHIIFESLYLSYEKIQFNFLSLSAMVLSDLLQIITNLAEVLVNIGFRISIPFLLVNTVMQLGLGVLSKLVPQVQVFFFSLPLQIFLGFTVLFLTAGSILLFFEKNTVSLYKSISFLN